MGSIYRKTTTRPVPAGATVTTRPDGSTVARWTPKGARRPVTAQVRTLDDGRQVIDQPTGAYYAKYRDAQGIVRTVSTGCRDESNARLFLADLERKAERVKAGVVTPAELAVSDHAAAPIRGHVDAYAATLGQGRHAADTRRYLERLAETLDWRTLGDLRRDALELWLAGQAKAGPDGKPLRSARSRTGFQVAAVAFCNWLVAARRLPANPFARMPKPNIDADRRRVRRALTPGELDRLIDAARKAPGRPPAKGKASDSLRPAVRLSGPSRAVLYAFLAGTGLRIREAGQVRVADLDLEGDRPTLTLSGAMTKNGQAATLPLRADLADALRAEVAGRRSADPVFVIPADLLRRFYADLKRAGIPRTDARGRLVDIHALRTTFGTHLAVAGVPLTTAQKLLRHSDPRLTANIYTDAGLLDLHGAVESLPRPPRQGPDPRAPSAGGAVPSPQNPPDSQAAHSEGED